MSAKDLWRSKDMSLYSFLVSRDVSPQVVAKLMTLNSIQFLDTNYAQSAFTREFSQDLASIASAEAKLKYLQEQVTKHEVVVDERATLPDNIPVATLDDEFAAHIKGFRALFEEYQAHLLNKIRAEEYYAVLRVLRGKSVDATAANYRDLMGEIDTNADVFSGAVTPQAQLTRGNNSPPVADDDEAETAATGAAGVPGAGAHGAGSGALNLVVVTINDKLTALLQRLIIRSTLSNCFIEVLDKKIGTSATVDLPLSTSPYAGNAAQGTDFSERGKKARKGAEQAVREDTDIVLIYVTGEALQNRCAKLAESIGASVHLTIPVTSFNFGDVPTLRTDMSAVSKRIDDFEVTLTASRARLLEILREVGARVPAWNHIIQREKRIYHTLNMFKVSSRSGNLLGVAWLPTAAVGVMEGAVELLNSRNKGAMPTIATDLHALSDRYKNRTAVVPRILEARRSHPVPNLEFEDVEDEEFQAPPDGEAENLAILRSVQTFYLKQPPTFFPTGKFTRVFQNVIESYGAPSYKEINPAFFYLYQFPFTFAVMFGDCGHGFINGAVALLMIIFERRIEKMNSDMISLIFAGRYLIFLMSIYSILTGSLYNDVFAFGFNFFGSRYSWQLVSESAGMQNFRAVYDTAKYATPSYAFGLDPFWHWADNSMIFVNSYKMKLAVVVGILQMISGLVLKLLNCIKMKDWLTLFSTWIPEFLFMVCFFGYMVFAILYKWLCYWPEGSNPPALTNMLIQMFLSPGHISAEGQLFNDVTFQSRFQLFLVFTCMISVVWLALIRPVYEIVEMKRHAKKAPKLVVPKKPKRGPRGKNADAEGLLSDEEDGADPAERNPMVVHEGAADSAGAGAAGGAPKHEDEEDEAPGIGDIVVHQVIHTIEYVLGCISHTASFLRLWALSLAHSQLAEVFFDQLFSISLGLKFSKTPLVNSIIMGVSYFITYTVWFAITIAVICLMEALSAFLHGLRLVWIEFNSKFFVAEGYSFEPLTMPVLGEGAVGEAKEDE